MRNAERRTALRLAALLVALGGMLPGAQEAALAQVACNSTAALQIEQHGTVEGQGFTASLTITNSGTTQLSNVSVTLNYTDPNNNSANSLFFAKVQSMQSIVAIDGSASAIINPGSAAQVKWLIVPANGAGGTNPNGTTYTVAAEVRYSAGGGGGSVQDTTPAPITVMPQPNLEIAYSIPSHVPGGTPFPMTVRIVNVGAGTAKNLQLAGGNPQLISQAGQPMSFQVVDAKVNGVSTSGGLLLNFGDLPPQGIAVGEWDMVASDTGSFTSFTANYTHSPDLGGTLTSPVSKVTTCTLLKTVAAVTTGSSAPDDSLVDCAGTGSADTLIAANGTNPPVLSKSGSLMSSSGQTFGVLDPPATGWAVTELANPPGGGVRPVQVIRNDGKVINPKNFWLKDGKLEILDYQPSGSYSVTLDPVAFDTTAPVTAFLPGAPSFGTSPSIAAPYSILGFSAKDDLSGVAKTQYRIDGGAFQTFSAFQPFVLPQAGLHTVDFFSSDFAGNTESTKTVSVLVDASVPVVAISTPPAGAQLSGLVTIEGTASAAHFAQYQLQVSAGSSWTTIATSTVPTVGTLGRWDTSRFSTGTYTIQLTAADVLGRVSTATVSVTVIPPDSQPPRTSLVIGQPSFSSATLYAAAITTVGLTAVDDKLVAGDGSGLGVAQTYLAVDTTSYSLYGGTFTLAVEGAHALSFYSVDVLGRAEAPKTAQVAVDRTAPATTLQLLASSDTAPGTGLSISTAVPLALFAVDPSSHGVASGVRVTQYSVDGATAAYSAPFTLSTGTHVVSFWSQDEVGNLEAARSQTFTVHLVDDQPPRTRLAMGAPRFDAGGSVYVATTTPFALSVVEDLQVPGDGAGLGVAQILLAVDTTAFSVYGGTFTLPSGPHGLSYRSVDVIGNAELAQSTSVIVDALPPVTAASVGAPQFTAADGTLFVTPATPVTFAAADPAISSGVAGSGAARVEVAVDSGAYAVYASSLTFAEGRHTVSYRAIDNVGNVETARTLALRSDATPPATALTQSGRFFTSGGRSYAPATFSYGFSAADPAGSDVASGVAFTRYGVSTSVYQVFGSTFALAEGIERVDFQSQDEVGNLELLKSATIYVDGTAPVTALTVGAPQYAAASGLLFVAAQTPLSLSSQDPVVEDVASGVGAVSVRVDSAAYALNSSSFTLGGADGPRTVQWFAADHAGNVEAVKSSSIAVDAAPPLTQLAVAGGRQFAGPDAGTFYASADTRLVLVSTDPAVGGVASGVSQTLWQDDGGSFAVSSGPIALPEGAHALSYQSRDNVENLEVLRSTRVWVDGTPPVSSVAIGTPSYTAADGTLYLTPATPVSFAAADPALPTGQPGSGVSRVELSLDGGAFAANGGPITLAEGRHTLLYRAVDDVGNVEAAHSLSLQSDATPPVSSLIVGAPQFALSASTLLVSSRTPFVIAAVDPVVAGVASGVKDTFFSIDGGSFAVYASSFSLALGDGPRTVSFYSRDDVLNTEVVKSSAVVLDATPPSVALLSPEAGASGICQVLKGKITVLGSAADAHLAGWVLDFAAGQNAASGFAQIAAGASAVSSGTLAVWDTSKLSGWQTLRLTATDLVGNVSVLTENVWIGDPAELLSLGGHDVFNMPQGVAAGPNGSIYVADTNADKIEVFSSTGTLLVSFGDGRHDKDKDGDEVDVSTTARFSKPRGAAVDGAGDVFVADTLNNRVVELSAAGQVLLELGNTQLKHDGDRVMRKGSLPGQFFEPSGVAVSAAGDIYVADTGNHRVQVLSSTGAVKLVFSLPPAGTAAKGDEDDDGPDDSLLGKPFGVAVDAAGKIYVADPKGHRALVYGGDGALLLTIPVTGSQPDGDIVAGEPQGIAVSPNGDCLLVSDRKLDRVLKFDALGNQLLSFGTRGHIPEGQAPPASVVFDKPVGLAFAPDGTLLVADRNNDRVERFGAPDGQGTLVVPAPQKPGDDLAKDVLDQDAGGEVKRADDAGVKIPAGALPEDLQISVSTVTPGDESQVARMARKAADSGLKPAYAPVDYGPEGTHFTSSVTLTIPYNPQLVADQGIAEDALQVHYWNPAKGDWEALPSEVDTVNHVVKAKTGHFSLYQVLGSSGASTQSLRPQALADPTFTFRDLYAFPNPAARGKNPTIRLQVGVADEVDIRFYDISGQQVGSASLTQPPVVLDDGNGKGAQYTYDYRWDTGGVGSGVYIYAVTAKKGGHGDIRRIKRLAVVH